MNNHSSSNVNEMFVSWGINCVEKKNKNFLIIYSPPRHPRRCSCLSFFSEKEIQVFEENISGFSPYSGLQWGTTV